MVILEDDAGFAADLILNSADMALEATTAATTTRRRNEAAGAMSIAGYVPHLCLAWHVHGGGQLA